MKDSTPSTQGGALESAPNDVAVATAPAVEDLLVGAFLAQMGPMEAPAAVVEQSLEVVRHEVASESRSAQSWSGARQVAAGLSWALRGPALGVNVGWASHGAAQTMQGLSMARYAFGTALMGRAPGSKRRRGWVIRLLLVGGGRA